MRCPCSIAACLILRGMLTLRLELVVGNVDIVGGELENVLLQATGRFQQYVRELEDITSNVER